MKTSNTRHTDGGFFSRHPYPPACPCSFDKVSAHAFSHAIIPALSIMETHNMPKTRNNAVMKWLYIFAFVVAFLVVFGGFVRLTRSGLSIVEWNPISGVIPPIGQQAWVEEFAKYQ